MRSGHAQPLVGARKHAEHLGALLHIEAVGAEAGQLLVAFGYRRCVHHERRLAVAAGVGYLVHVLVIMEQHALLLQLRCQGGRSLVVTGHHHAPAQEVTGDGTHANAACTYEIYCFYVVQFHCCL